MLHSGYTRDTNRIRCESGDHTGPSASVLTLVNCRGAPTFPAASSQSARNICDCPARPLRRDKSNLPPIRRKPPPALPFLPESNLPLPTPSPRRTSPIRRSASRPTLFSLPSSLFPTPSHRHHPHRHNPKMRGLRIRRQIHIHYRKHHPLPARRHLRIAHPPHPLQIGKRHRPLPCSRPGSEPIPPTAIWPNAAPPKIAEATKPASIFIAPVYSRPHPRRTPQRITVDTYHRRCRLPLFFRLSSRTDPLLPLPPPLPFAFAVAVVFLACHPHRGPTFVVVVVVVVAVVFAVAIAVAVAVAVAVAFLVCHPHRGSAFVVVLLSFLQLPLPLQLRLLFLLSSPKGICFRRCRCL